MPAPLLLRVRRALDCTDVPWQLRYIGQPELGKFKAEMDKYMKINFTFDMVFYAILHFPGPQGDKTRPTIVRSSIDIGTNSAVVEFLTELGCRMDFEYIVRGYMFRKGRMKITVSKIFKVCLPIKEHSIILLTCYNCCMIGFRWAR